MPTVPLGDFSFKGSMIQGGLLIGTAPAGTQRVSFNGDEVPVASDGRFVIAFDRDAGPAATVTAVLADDQSARLEHLAAVDLAEISRTDAAIREITTSRNRPDQCGAAPGHGLYGVAPTLHVAGNRAYLDPVRIAAHLSQRRGGGIPFGHRCRGTRGNPGAGAG
jgi:hypothetical protein